LSNGFSRQFHLFHRTDLFVGDFPSPALFAPSPTFSVPACNSLSRRDSFGSHFRFVFGYRGKDASVKSPGRRRQRKSILQRHEVNVPFPKLIKQLAQSPRCPSQSVQSPNHNPFHFPGSHGVQELSHARSIQRLTRERVFVPNSMAFVSRLPPFQIRQLTGVGLVSAAGPNVNCGVLRHDLYSCDSDELSTVIFA
jgi:hypothetical protein